MFHPAARLPSLRPDVSFRPPIQPLPGEPSVNRKINAVTFDLWDTIVHDDSDEPKRKAKGLRSKKAERRHLLWQALSKHSPISEGEVTLAYDVADAAFNRVWHEQHVTWRIGERLDVAIKGLGRKLPPEDFAELVRKHEEMEVEIRPDLIAGIVEALAEIHERYRTCVVSDAIVTPGRCLRQLIASYDLARHFDGYAFSDEVGHSKPHRSMFEYAARQMGVSIEEILHVGDRDHNDVKGPQRLGMKAILFIGTRAVDRDRTSANGICARHADLPNLIDQLAGT
jgi:putative hydrolase of the HAD superfamily